jgi:hypothetical protein
MKIEEKLYKEKYLKKRATEINYKMHEIKPSYCSEKCSPTGRHGYGFIEEKLGLETYVNDSSTLL